MKKYIKPEDRIFVAGSSGMVGSAVIRKLKEKGGESLVLEHLKKEDLIGHHREVMMHCHHLGNFMEMNHNG